jgi:hypothetical protein
VAETEFKLDFKIAVENFSDFHTFLMDNRLKIKRNRNTFCDLNKFEMLNDVQKDPILKILEYGKKTIASDEMVTITKKRTFISFKKRITNIVYPRFAILNEKFEESDARISNDSYNGFEVEFLKNEIREFEIAYVVSDNDFELKWEKNPTFWINYLYSMNYMTTMDNEFYFIPDEFRIKDMKSKNISKFNKKFNINDLFKEKK